MGTATGHDVTGHDVTGLSGTLLIGIGAHVSAERARKSCQPRRDDHGCVMTTEESAVTFH